jgi:hypothetical protein
MKVKRTGELSYYESKIKLLNMPDLDPTLLKLGCWDAPYKAVGLSDQRKCESFAKQCRKYYEKKIERIHKDQRAARRGRWLARIGL